VHGDLTGNVLLVDGLPPAVIDMSCYWLPPSWAPAIVAADALARHSAAPKVVGLVPGPRPVAMVARAALYRLVTSDRHATRLASERTSYLAHNGAAYDRVLSVLDALAARADTLRSAWSRWSASRDRVDALGAKASSDFGGSGSGRPGSLVCCGGPVLPVGSGLLVGCGPCLGEPAGGQVVEPLGRSLV